MEKMWGVSKKKIAGIVLGLLLLVGSGVVVGLTVVRIQNEKATIDQPKAVGGGDCPTSTNFPCLHKNSQGQFDCCDNCDARVSTYNSSTGRCTATCGGGRCFYDKGSGNWQESPNYCNTQACTPGDTTTNCTNDSGCSGGQVCAFP